MGTIFKGIFPCYFSSIGCFELDKRSINLGITKTVPESQFYILDMWILFSFLIWKQGGKAFTQCYYERKKIEQYQIKQTLNMCLYTVSSGVCPLWTGYNASWKVCLECSMMAKWGAMCSFFTRPNTGDWIIDFLWLHSYLMNAMQNCELIFGARKNK